MLDCALISSDEGFRQIVLGILRQPAAQARLAVDLQILSDGLGGENAEKVFRAAPQVVFLDLGQDPSGVGGIQVLADEAPDMALIVAGPELSADGLLAVMRGGAAEYLPRPFSLEDTLQAFQRVRRKAKPGTPDAAPTLGHVSTVFSAKGGTGVTTVATNLAIALRQLTNKETLLLDLAPTLGTAAVAMGVQGRYTYLDVIQNFHRIDEELLRSFLETHETGVQILASPLSPADLEPPSGDDLLGLVRLCKKHFDYVVIDGGNSLSGQVLSLLHESDDRLFVVTPELPTLRNLKQAMDLFVRMNGKTPPQVVLNQYKEGLGLSSRDVEEGLGQRVFAVLERDEVRVLQSINVGRPEVLAGKSRIAKEFMDLGTKLAGPEMIVSPQQGLLGRIFRSSKGAETSGKETK